MSARTCPPRLAGTLSNPDEVGCTRRLGQARGSQPGDAAGADVVLASRAVRIDDLRLIAVGDPEIALMPARPEIKESRFAQGARCLGAFRKDRLIGYVWLAFGGYEEDEVRCTFEVVPFTTVRCT